MIAAFIDALKRHLRSSDKEFITEGNLYAHGDTETGFYPNRVLDMDELEAEIDAFSETFKKDNLEAELGAALAGLMSGLQVHLGDLVYDVREREGLGWEGPDVVAWGQAVEKAEKALAKFKAKGQ